MSNYLVFFYTFAYLIHTITYNTYINKYIHTFELLSVDIILLLWFSFTNFKLLLSFVRFASSFAKFCCVECFWSDTNLGFPIRYRLLSRIRSIGLIFDYYMLMFCILKPDFIDEVENYKGFIFISGSCDQKFLNPVNQEKNCLAFHFDRVN